MKLLIRAFDGELNEMPLKLGPERFLLTSYILM